MCERALGKCLIILKSIKSSLEVDLVYCGDSALPKDFTLLDKWLIVSRVYAGRVDSADVNVLGKFEVQGHSFAIRKAQMAKCERCWQFVGESGALCERCSAVVATL